MRLNSTPSDNYLCYGLSKGAFVDDKFLIETFVVFNINFKDMITGNAN